jgi:hypothetical protein
LYADKAAFQTLMRDFLVSLREYNCDQWTQSSLALQLEAQQKETLRQQVPPLLALWPPPAPEACRGLATSRPLNGARMLRVTHIVAWAEVCDACCLPGCRRRKPSGRPCQA